VRKCDGGKPRHNTRARNIPVRNALRIRVARSLNHRADRHDRRHPKALRAEAVWLRNPVGRVEEGRRCVVLTPTLVPGQDGDPCRESAADREAQPDSAPGKESCWHFSHTPAVPREWRLQVVARPARPVHAAGKKARLADIPRHKVLLMWDILRVQSVVQGCKTPGSGRVHVPLRCFLARG
jgi:hypothetical protein